MIFYVFISVVTLIYILAVGALVMELIAHPSKEERHNNQSFQLLFATSLLYLALIRKAIQLNACGILTLM